jgi:hypothetical protein
MQATKEKYLIPESVYDYDHPEVVFWTMLFSERAKTKNVFSNYNATLFHRENQFDAAMSVAAAWYDFTCYVPTFIAKAVAKANDPEWQHHLIQIAYDELGGRYKENIHSSIFIEAIESIGLKITKTESHSGIQEILGILDRSLEKTSNRQGIIGLLLSFEIIALENIEALLSGLCHSDSHREKLLESKFFKIHRADETEHIRHSVANFLRFCKTESDKKEFMVSFDAGIDYWQRFWDQMSRIILVNQVPYQKRA